MSPATLRALEAEALLPAGVSGRVDGPTLARLLKEHGVACAALRRVWARLDHEHLGVVGQQVFAALELIDQDVSE